MKPARWTEPAIRIGFSLVPGCIRVSEDEISELVIKLPLASRHTVCLPLPPHPSLTVAPEVVSKGDYYRVGDIEDDCVNVKLRSAYPFTGRAVSC